MKQFKDSEQKRRRDRFGYHAFLILALCLALGEILAMMFAWENSFPRVLLCLCLSGGYYICRSIWSEIYFRPGESKTVLALGLTGGIAVAVWRLAESFLSSSVSQDGIWSYRAVWIEGLIFCLTILSVVAWKSFKERQSRNH